MQPLPIRGESTAQSPQALSKSLKLTSLRSFPSTSGNQTTDSQPIPSPPAPSTLGPPGRTPGSESSAAWKRAEERGKERGEKGRRGLSPSRIPKEADSRPPAWVLRPRDTRSEMRLRDRLAPGKFGDRLGNPRCGTWQQVGASQTGGRTLNVVAAGWSLALSSSGAPRMIRAGQSRSRPCVPPGAGSRTKGERAWQHLGERKAVCGPQGIPLPQCTASSRRWPRRHCMVLARRRVQPAARLLPCRGLRAPADAWGRWRRSRDAPGSAPPPRSLTLSPTSGGYRTARGGDSTADTDASRLACPAPPGVTCL